MHPFRGTLRVWLVFASACASLPASTLFYSRVGGTTNGNGSFNTPFMADVGFATLQDLAQTPLNGIERTERWAATGNLTAGAAHLYSAGNINGGTMDFTDALVNTFVSMGDTVTYTGSTFGGLNLTARITVDGSWQSFVPAGSTLTNYSFLRFLFLKPGSFDTPNFFAPSNLIGQSFYGLGPNPQELPFGVHYDGNIPIGGSVDISMALAGLPQGTQIVMLAQDYVEGTMTPGGQGVSWVGDFGSTLHYSLIAPEGVTVTTAGGLPVTQAAATPEPSSITMILLSALGLAFRRGAKGLCRTHN